VVLQGRADNGYADRTDDSDLAELRSARGPSMIPWGVVAIDLDRDGRTDLVFAHGNDESAWDGDRIGPQRLSAHWNGGGLRFADVSSAVHLDRPGQFMALSVTDLDGDGDPDLLAGGEQEPPRVYENAIAGGHALSLRLRGTTSNPLGLGARVTVVAGGRTQRAIAGGLAAPLAMPEPLLFFGLGDAVTADVQVDWPSGTRQALAGQAVDRLVVVREPPSIVIDPPSREVPADGTSKVRVTVNPPTAGRVTVEVDGQAVAVAVDGPAAVAEVTAPTAPGSAVVRVSVDGRALGVRPRLFFR